MRAIFSQISDWLEFHLARGWDTIYSFVVDAFPFMLLFAVVGVAGTLTGLTTFTFLDQDPTVAIVAGVRAGIEPISQKVDTVDAVITKQNELLVANHDVLMEIKTAITADTSGGRRHRATADIEPSCVKLPSGFDVDVGTLTEAAKGVNVLGTGETYSAALVRHGFQASEVEQLDEETCRKIYDGWRSLYPPASFRYGSGTNSGRWTCTGGRCYRNY